MEITKETAKRLYPAAENWFKEQLEEAFGKECFLKKDFRDMKIFEDACAELDIDPALIANSEDNRDEAAYKKLKVIIKAVNQGWTPDWGNTNQMKWFPYFILSSGFGFSRSDYNCGGARASVGSRLCFESEEKSNYIGKQFVDLYKEFLI